LTVRKRCMQEAQAYLEAIKQSIDRNVEELIRAASTSKEEQYKSDSSGPTGKQHELVPEDSGGEPQAAGASEEQSTKHNLLESILGEAKAVLQCVQREQQGVGLPDLSYDLSL
jgi:uncharacterized sporulation protein YeaH/YhbH (DUF444 family)